jgi:hypothetical protein
MRYFLSENVLWFEVRSQTCFCAGSTRNVFYCKPAMGALGKSGTQAKSVAAGENYGDSSPSAHNNDVVCAAMKNGAGMLHRRCL